ncbi:MAG: hypothetical protein JXB32_23185 [Deltaproteobacteria bacterium]|nr:hypothetical protein [Deltaproteobacteria bacterium]
MARAHGNSGSTVRTVGILAAATALAWSLADGSNGLAGTAATVAPSPGPLQDDDRDDPPPRLEDDDTPGTPVALPAPSPGGDGAAAERPSVRRADLAARSARIPRPIPGRRLTAQRTESATRPEPPRPLACPTRGPPFA